jgi:hypothetical protein
VVKGAHLRKSVLNQGIDHPLVQRIAFVSGLCLFGIGIGHMIATAQATEDRIYPAPRTTTTTEVILRVVNPAPSALPTTTESVPTPVPRKSSITKRPAVSVHSAPHAGYGYGGTDK